MFISTYGTSTKSFRCLFSTVPLLDHTYCTYSEKLLQCLSAIWHPVGGQVQRTNALALFSLLPLAP